MAENKDAKIAMDFTKNAFAGASMVLLHNYGTKLYEAKTADEIQILEDQLVKDMTDLHIQYDIPCPKELRREVRNFFEGTLMLTNAIKEGDFNPRILWAKDHIHYLQLVETESKKS